MKMGSRPLELMPVDLSPAGVARSLLWPSAACNICAKGSTCERICAPADSPTRHSFCLLCAAQYTGLARNVQLSWIEPALGLAGPFPGTNGSGLLRPQPGLE